MKTNTIALVVSIQNSHPVLLDILSDEQEIHFVETALRAGETHPLELIYENRAKIAQHDEELGNHIEDLFSERCLKLEIQEHAIQWLRSKIKIEQYQKAEKEAAQVIAAYAFQIFQCDRSRVDFFLAGPNSQVRVRIFELADETGLPFCENA